MSKGPAQREGPEDCFQDCFQELVPGSAREEELALHTVVSSWRQEVKPTEGLVEKPEDKQMPRAPLEKMEKEERAGSQGLRWE
ncbi:hypothetical protein NDU88_003166 [Pleurodeles waltl]|uniref:Uncharacterized protein n=1 Tax=Pleurodeles waltl TaxID=8319 RepID=A0AAV7WSS9_PLEWA|nr:hypothetical protein NDU88_003166 [Pleurodeles waltl]